MKPVCLIIGAGAGIGGHVGKRFAREGFHVALCRRTNQAGLDQLVAEIEGEGGAASGYLLNAAEENTIEERIRAIEAETGPIEVVLYNLGAQIGDRPLEETPLK
ncbi:MAG: SDR family NAD(P)-dependent oxidoreductase, partial [Gammaproteobacteria bacterium]|nr:SDR family NAD(P)-dependent oxidoreductase [Gammaproteobacteria bacterium]